MTQPLGGGELSFQDLVRIVRRRFWWFAVPAAGVAVGSLALALLLPAVYEGAAVVNVEPQGISPELAQSSIVEDAERRYNTLLLHALKRESLSRIIDQFGLYSAENETELRDVTIQRMRENDITIEPLPPAIVNPHKPVTLESFRIAFRSKRRAIVADVANELTRGFRDAHIKLQSEMASQAERFVRDELSKVVEQFEETRSEITGYKEANRGALPEELVLNSQRLEKLRIERSTLITQAAIAQDQIGRIRSEMEDVRRSATTDENDPTQRKQVLELMLNRFRAEGKTDKHPDVVQTIAEIEALEGIIDEYKAGGNPPPVSPMLAALRRELRNHEVNQRVFASGVAELDEQIAALELNLGHTPRHAAELERMEGTATALDGAIQQLQLKLVHARTGEELVRDLLGEKFQVVEWAKVPDAPVSPNRPLWFLVGSTLGLMLGLGVLALRELTDMSFDNAGELQKSIHLPVLASVPRIRLPAEAARRRAQLRRVGVSAAAAVLLIVGGSFVYYLLSQENVPASIQASPASDDERPGDV